MRQAPLVQWWAGGQPSRAGRSGGASGTGRTGPPPSGGRYGLLLLLLILTYLLSASGLTVLVADIQTVLFLGAVLLALRTSRMSQRLTRLVAAVALVGTVAATAAMLTHTPGGEGASDIWKGLMLLLRGVPAPGHDAFLR